MVKPSKVQTVTDFVEQMEGRSLIFFDYDGVDVDTLNSLRNQCRDQGSRIKVLKNTLLKRALGEKNITVEDGLLQGMIATVVAENESFGASGKILLSAERRESLVIKGGFYESEMVNADHVRKYATLPNREELYGMLVGALEGIVNNLVVVLGQVGEGKSSGASAPSVEKPAAESAKSDKGEDKKAEAVKAEATAKEPEASASKEEKPQAPAKESEAPEGKEGKPA